MKQLTNFLFTIAIILITKLSLINATTEKELTISVEPGTRECFYEQVKVDDIIDIEYQVIDGGHGELDISFELSDPNGRILFADFKKSDNIYRHKTNFDGDIRFCFDNTFSRISRKTVFFEIIIENEFQEPKELPENVRAELMPEATYETSFENILNAINHVHVGLEKIHKILDFIKSFEARDRHIAEENYFRVNAWSFFQICMMLAVGALQVIMIRSLFDINSKVHVVLKKMHISS